MSRVHLERDIGCATFLYCSGFEFIDLVPVPAGNRYNFRFADPDARAASLVSRYHRGETSVDAKRLMDGLKHMKDMLYLEKRNGDGNGNGNNARP